MEEALGHWSEYIALMAEAVAIGVVFFGALEAFVRLFQPFFEGPPDAGWRRSIWNDFGMWLLLGLQFALAACAASLHQLRKILVSSLRSRRSVRF
jgi:hypothetical protein